MTDNKDGYWDRVAFAGRQNRALHALADLIEKIESLSSRDQTGAGVDVMIEIVAGVKTLDRLVDKLRGQEEGIKQEVLVLRVDGLGEIRLEEFSFDAIFTDKKNPGPWIRAGEAVSHARLTLKFFVDENSLTFYIRQELGGEIETNREKIEILGADVMDIRDEQEAGRVLRSIILLCEDVVITQKEARVGDVAAWM